MSRKFGLILLVVLSLLLVMVPACGGDDDDGTSPLTPTVTPTGNTATSTPTPGSSGPIRIGAIVPWTGPMAGAGVLGDKVIALVEWQVKQMGGILGGREVEFVRGDDAGQVSQSAAQAKKLILDEKVAALTLGGSSAASIKATATVAEEYEVPFVAFATIYGVKDMKSSASLYGTENINNRIANFLIDYLKPKKVAFLSYEGQDAREVINGSEGITGVRELLKAAGIDIVYEDYFIQETIDFTSFLTKIKYQNPDVVCVRFQQDSQAVTMVKQITELGGLGNIKFFGGTESWLAARFFSGALNTYSCALWIPGSDDPGMKAYEDAWKSKYNAEADPNGSYYYNCFWTVIKAMQQAGTDNSSEVAKVLRSGNLEWDSAWGHLRIPAAGIGDVKIMVAQIQKGGKLVKVYPGEAPAPTPSDLTPTPEPTTPGGAIHTGLDIDSKIGELMANEYTAAVVEKCMQGKTVSAAGYGYTFKFLAPYDPVKFTPEVMKCLEEGLAAIK